MKGVSLTPTIWGRKDLGVIVLSCEIECFMRIVLTHSSDELMGIRSQSQRRVANPKEGQEVRAARMMALTEGCLPSLAHPSYSSQESLTI